jgi:iron complex outermembrane receptor protein
VCAAISITSITHADPIPENGDNIAPLDSGGIPELSPQILKDEVDPLSEADADIELLADLEIPIVTAATRRDQRLNEIPHAISIITADDIRRTGARSIADALRLAPGVDVSDLSAAQFALSPRGLQGFLSNQTLVLVDGRQIFDSAFWGTLWESWPFQLEDIDRIEVLRGPGGVMWGANALNGVINVVTKDPEDQQGLTTVVGGGSRGTAKGYVGYGVKTERLRFRASAEYRSSDGFLGDSLLFGNVSDEFKAASANVHLIYEPTLDDKYTVSIGSRVMDGGFDPMPLETLFRRRNSGSQAAFLLGKWEHRVNDNENYALTGFVNDFHASPGIHSIDYRYQQIGLQYTHQRRMNQHHFSWGVDSRVDVVDASNSDPFMLSKDFVSTGIIGVYFHDAWTLSPKWNLSLGGRIDYEFYGGFQPSATGSLTYRLSEDSIVYGSVSRAFSMPPAASRFLDTPLVGGIARVTSDQEISPRTMMGYELGYRGTLWEHLDVSLNVYWHEYADLAGIPILPGPPGLARRNFQTMSDASLYGIEVESRLRVTDELTVLGNYTWQRLDWRSDLPFHLTDQMTPPEHKFMAGLRYSPTDDLHLSGHLNYVDDVEAADPTNPFAPTHIDSYYRLDLTAEYEFLDDQASIRAGVTNLLDPVHPEGGSIFFHSSETPRMVFVELRVRGPKGKN